MYPHTNILFYFTTLGGLVARTAAESQFLKQEAVKKAQPISHLQQISQVCMYVLYVVCVCVYVCIQ
jgi:hypothetical protein